MKIHRIVMYVIDFDNMGADEVKSTLEHTRYPNHCISPTIAEVQTRDIGSWSDEHPLNQRSTMAAARVALFADMDKSNPV